MQWLYRILSRSRPYKALIEWSHRASLPGFESLPLYTVITFFFKEIRRESLNMRATSLAFNFLLALFPATIFLFTLIPYIPIENFQDQLMFILLQLLPRTAFEATKTTLDDIIRNQNGGLLSFGFIFALFFSTNGVSSLMNAFNKSSLVLESRSAFKKHLIATGLVIMLSFLIFICISILVVGEHVIDFLKDEGLIKDKLLYYSLFFIRWVIIVALFFFATSILYYYGPAVVKRRKFFSAGSTLATALAIFTSLGFAYYINNFGQYNKIYGSIGTLIVIMLWLYINSLILLIGFELNASIYITKRNIPAPPKRNTIKTPVTEVVEPKTIPET